MLLACGRGSSILLATACDTGLQQSAVRRHYKTAKEDMQGESGMEGINTNVKPSGTGCVECLESGKWWFHLRRCAECGHVGCCDSSPNQHARKHFHKTGHAVIQSFEPGEEWFWDFAEDAEVDGTVLAAPHSHPRAQSVPGPADRVPANWQSLLH